VYEPVGCAKCQSTGFRDRIGIYEMIKMDDSVRSMVIEKRDASAIRERCIEAGFKTMLEDGVDKVLQGITALDEVLRVIRE
jgi:type II secretory ATPase GspE/PulE/Tfp pilus assembly ATPase PilB-like protein